MKSIKIHLFGAVALVGMGLFSSCIDQIKFGNAFLDKPTGSVQTKDTLFSNAEYTRRFLNGIYAQQYYGLPYNNAGARSSSPYTGKFDALTDCWQLNWNSTSVYNYYYKGILNASAAGSSVFPYAGEKVWEVVRAGWQLIENIENVPEMEETEKKRMVAEAKCLIAARYFDMFRFYGGLPLIKNSLEGLEAGDYAAHYGRATVDETVKFMVGLLDDAIKTPELPWAFDADEAANETGHWTQAGAMALKCQILQFAASPLFNSDKGYYGGTTEAEQKHLVWYGNYDKKRWDDCLQACREFFNTLSSKGGYKLNETTKANPTPADYRQAYRMGYVALESPEILHSVRVTGIDAFKSGRYFWHSWSDNGRNSYTPTQEYVEMFPWADGTPFDWDKTKAEGKLDEMFMRYKNNKPSIANTILTRDPRLYETARVNGMPNTLDWTKGTMGGNPYELWIGGYDAQQQPILQSGSYATGYDNMKYWLGSEYARKYTQWVYLRLSDLYLIYAEALLQSAGDNAAAIQWVDKVRARVGLKGLVECNPTENLENDKDNLLKEILRERVCELGMENSRYFDIVRYKMGSVLTKPLHGLLIYRLDANGKRVETKWRDGDQKTGAPQPTHFDYEKTELKTKRVWWGQSTFDAKWYLSPFPNTEVNKGYGLVQNPGW